LSFSSLIRCLSFRLPSPWFCWWCIGMGERTMVFSWWSCESLLLWCEGLWFVWWSLCIGDASREALPSPSLAMLLADSLCRQHRGACSDWAANLWVPLVQVPTEWMLALKGSALAVMLSSEFFYLWLSKVRYLYS
jgi:hypothetical protein